MKKKDGVYAQFYVVKDGLEFPIQTINLRDLSRILTESIIGVLENIIYPKGTEKDDKN